MSDVTRVLSRIEQGDPSAAEQLLPLVYDDLRRLAAIRLAQETPGQTLQATALVHDAFLRLVDADRVHSWDSRRHFFAAAAEAMRRILIDIARRKQAQRHGGGLTRRTLDEGLIAGPQVSFQVLAISDALDVLAARDDQAAELVKLRYFAGLSREQAAQTLGVSPRTADRIWTYARSFLLRELEKP